jgi:hypothetical protein
MIPEMVLEMFVHSSFHHLTWLQGSLSEFGCYESIRLCICYVLLLLLVVVVAAAEAVMSVLRSKHSAR